MAWYVGAFEKTGDELMVKQLSTVGIDEYLIRELWSIGRDDYPIFAASYPITRENVDRLSGHVAEEIDLDAYSYQLFNEGD